MQPVIGESRRRGEHIMCVPKGYWTREKVFRLSNYQTCPHQNGEKITRTFAFIIIIRTRTDVSHSPPGRRRAFQYTCHTTFSHKNNERKSYLRKNALTRRRLLQMIKNYINMMNGHPLIAHSTVFAYSYTIANTTYMFTTYFVIHTPPLCNICTMVCITM